MQPDVTIVIATYNRRERLLVCLDRIARQTLAPERFEVVVVSDAATDGTVEAARSRAAALPFALRVLEIPHGGPGAARNAGAAHARAPLLAFTDDDVEVEAGWLEAAVGHFESAAVGGVEGRTEAVLGEESLYSGNVSNTGGGIYPTCNMFYRKAAFEQVGGFDLGFRRAREDSDLAFRVLDAGYRIVFEPKARVAHRSHRSSVALPLGHAATIPDTVRLYYKHPGRDALRSLLYPSDAVKIGLVLAGVAALVAGHPWLALAAGLVFAVLVARTMRRELVLARALRPDRLLASSLVYAVLPFANVAYLLAGMWRARAAATSAAKIDS